LEQPLFDARLNGEDLPFYEPLVRVLRKGLLMRLILLIAALLPAVGSAEERPGLAALDVDAERGVDSSLAKLISEAILSELKESGRFATVIGSSDITTMINIEQQKQALGCEEDSCLAQLGGALGVPYLFSGSLGSVGGRYMLNLKLLQVEDARVAERMTRIFADERALVDGLKPALTHLLRTLKAPVSTSVATVQAPAKGAWKTWVVGGMGALGLGLVGASFSLVEGAQSSHNSAPSVATAIALEDAVRLGNVGVVGALVVVGAGTAVWLW
jgi:hypothetical protein